jgi:hypothetical protein
MVKLPEIPNPGFCDMNGGIVATRRENGQYTIFKKLTAIVMAHDRPPVFDHASS